jgi:hypothetical protein
MDYVPLNRRHESEDNAMPEAAPPPMPPASRVAPARAASPRESGAGLSAPSPSAPRADEDESGALLAKYAGDRGGMKDEIPEDELTAAQRADREREQRAQIIGGFAKILSGGRAQTPDANAHAAQDVLARREQMLKGRAADRSDQYLPKSVSCSTRGSCEDEDRPDGDAPR